MPVHRKRQRARIPKNKPKRKRAFTTVRRDGRECALFFRSFRRCAAGCTEPCRLQHAAVLCGEHSSTCRTVLEYFAESTIQHSATHSPVFRPAALPRRGQPSGQRGRAPYPPHKRIRTQTRSLLGGHRKRPITPNQPHAPLGTNHLPRSVSVTKPLPGIRSTPAPPLLRPPRAHVRFATVPKAPCGNNSETTHYGHKQKNIIKK